VSGEKDGGAGRVELRVGDGQRGDVKGLEMRVRVSVDLCFWLRLFVSFRVRVKDRVRACVAAAAAAAA